MDNNRVGTAHPTTSFEGISVVVESISSIKIYRIALLIKTINYYNAAGAGEFLS